MENATRLALGMCVLLNFPEERVDCDENHNCVSCPRVGKFISGEGLDDYTSRGHVTCLVLNVLTGIVGLGGFLMSSLIIIVLRRRNSNKSFDILLTVLAHVDLLCCLLVVILAISMIGFWQNWDRGLVTVSVFFATTLTTLFARSASCLMTVVIAIERYLVVAFPHSSSNWFTPVKTKVMAGFAVGLSAFLILLPRGSRATIGANRFRGVKSVTGLDYLVYTSSLERFWMVELKGVLDIIDFWVPFPLLLIFNGLIFYHIRKFRSRRLELNLKLKKDLRASQLVAPVVMTLFLCNIEPITAYYYFVTRGIMYREAFVGMFLSVAINSAANFPIYYMKAPGFKDEARQVLGKWLSFLKNADGEGDKPRAVFYFCKPPTPGSSYDVVSMEEES